MKAFVSDWRNVTLSCAGIVILVLLVLLFKNSVNAPSPIVAVVGGTRITYQQAFDAMKQAKGNEAVMRLIADALIESYAKKEKVSASAGEIEQLMKLMRLQVEMQGGTLEEQLKREGTTLAARKRQIAIEIMRAKLIVPEKDVKAAYPTYAKRTEPPMVIPAYYKIRRFLYTSKADADKVGALLKEKDGDKKLAELKTALGSADATKPALYMPGMMQEIIPGMDKAVKGMKAGETSKPIAVGNGQIYAVIHMLAVMPEDKPTYETRNALIAMELARDEKYAQVVADLEAKALQKVDIQFLSTDFPEVYEQIREMQKTHPNLPSAPDVQLPGMTPLPGGGPGAGPRPGAPTPRPDAAPTARPGASGGR